MKEQGVDRVSALVIRFFLLSLLVFLSQDIPAQEASLQIADKAEFKSEIAKVPCNNGKRLEAARALFERMGAPQSDITVVKFKNVENLLITKKGETDDKIVLSAHYDKVIDGCGAIDNWTGIVLLSRLYSSLKNIKLNKTLVFVAFGKEEQGLLGSRAMVDSIGEDELLKYCAAINLDSFGLGMLQVAGNMSSKKLAQFTKATAEEMKLRIAQTHINGDSDSSSFIRRKIPAVTIVGLSSDWPTILHSLRDQAQRIDIDNVYSAYRLALSMVMRLEQSGCQDFR